MSLILRLPQQKRMRLVHMSSVDGHRHEYLDLFTSIFNLRPSVGKVGRRNLIRLVLAEALFFGTIDDDYFGFFFVALLRAAFGKKTVGLFLRPQTCFLLTGFRYKAKKVAFALMKRVSKVRVFTIIPFSVAQEYAEVADAGLVDPQMWDKTDGCPGKVDSELSLNIRDAAKHRKVLAFVGTASSIKGIEFLRNLMATQSWPKDQILVVIAGRIPDGMGKAAEELERYGAMVLPRFISDTELLAVYTEADFIWACYRPDYDQASGVFGRAIQFSKVPIVRLGSLTSRFAKQSDIPSIEIGYNITDQSAKLIATRLKEDSNFVIGCISKWKIDFIKKVSEAM